MSLRESKVANGARRSAVAVRNADHKMGSAAQMTTEFVGGAIKILVLGSAAVAGFVYMAKLLDGPVKELAADATTLLPDFPSRSVELRTPVRVNDDPAILGDELWDCTDEVRSSGTINDYLGRMVISEYGLGDHNNSATYDIAIDLLNTDAFQNLNPHITNINEPPMGETIVFPVCE